MSQSRRLAAILAADVAGYSRLMGADEEGTHERLKAHLRELVEPKIVEHRGRIVKNTGDGFLAEFASVVDAVRCAVEMQRGMMDREPEASEEQRIRFRIGVNLGDVIVEEHDIFGDGVNVAARLEGLAEPAAICVSRVVRDQVRDKLDLAFEDMGEQSVKNITRPVRAYALRPEAIALLPANAPTAPPTPQPVIAPRLSIVVLPFANLSNDPDQQYFADGITEDLTTDLSRLADMRAVMPCRPSRWSPPGGANLRSRSRSAVGGYAVSVKAEPVEEHKESGIILDLTGRGHRLNNRAAILQSKIT